MNAFSTKIALDGRGEISMCKKNIVRTCLYAQLAKITFRRVDDKDLLLLKNCLDRTNFLATATLAANMDFKHSRSWKLSCDMDRRFFWIILFIMVKRTDQLAERATRATFMIE
jgi:hypothetical protein